MGPVLLLSSLLATPPAAVPAASYLPAAPAATVWQPPLVYRIQRRGSGYVYQASTFEARIDRDGAVRFRDDHGALGLLLPIVAPERLPEGTPTLEGSIRQALAHRRNGPPRSPPPPRAPAPGPGQTSGGGGGGGGRVVLEICEDARCVDRQQVVGVLGASFDVTDEIMRLSGEDPYRARKARFLADTAEWRLRLAHAQRDRSKGAALAGLEGQLLAAWKHHGLTGPERRRVLFNLWLEMDQASPEGRQGAATVIRFVREQLPAGSPDAFTADELRALNQAAAPQRFDPYGG